MVGIMKRAFYILLSFFLALPASAQIDLGDELDAYFPFLGDAHDASGNRHHGVVYGATLTEDRFDNPNNAYYFDGVDDGIVKQDGDIKGMMYTFPPATFAAWVYLEGHAEPKLRSIFAMNDGGDYPPHPLSSGIFSAVTEEGQFAIWIGDGSLAGSDSRRGIIANDPLPTDRWVHVAANIYHATSMQIYIDGQAVDGTLDGTGGTGMQNRNEYAKIGYYDMGMGMSPWQGMLDEIRLYDRALSEEEIQALYADNTGSVDQPNVLITEVMQNPNDVADYDGEWFEIYNAMDEPIDLFGWTIDDGDGEKHVISRPLYIQPYSTLVLCNNDDVRRNGGVPCDYVYLTIQFERQGDALILRDPDGFEVSRVEYARILGFRAARGASMYFTGGPTDDVNSYVHWTLSTERLANYPVDTCRRCKDLGSPGSVENTLLALQLENVELAVDETLTQLSWTTDRMTVPAGFEVQQKTAFGEFETVGWVDGVADGEYTFSLPTSAANLKAFRLKQVGVLGEVKMSTEINDIQASAAVTDGFLIESAYPNPFNPTTNLSFLVEEAQPVHVEVYDMLGRRVMQLFNGTARAQTVYPLQVSGANLSSGTYVVRITGQSFQKSMPIQLMK